MFNKVLFPHPAPHQRQMRVEKFGLTSIGRSKKEPIPLPRGRQIVTLEERWQLHHQAAKGRARSAGMAGGDVRAHRCHAGPEPPRPSGC